MTVVTRKLLAAAFAFCLILGCTLTAAHAHASLVGVSPPDGAVLEDSPSAVLLNFNEPASPLKADLILPTGEAIPLAGFSVEGATIEVTLPPDLEQGSHVLSWRAVSGDGHPISGATVFSLGSPTAEAAAEATSGDPAAKGLLWAMRFTLFLALFFGVGGAAFLLLAGSLPKIARRTSAALVLSGIGAAVLTPGLQGVDALGLPLSGLLSADTWSAGLSTGISATIAYALASLILAFAALVAGKTAAARWASAIALLGIGLAVCSSGHAAAAEPQWLTRPALFAHVIAVAWWVGALFPLGLLLATGNQFSARPLVRFSKAIPFAVAPLVVSGLILAGVQLGWPGPAWLTGYGYILGGKILLLILLFSIASWNRWVLTAPAVIGKQGAMRQMRRSIFAEIVLIIVILGLVSVWRFTPPPRALAGESMLDTVTVQLESKGMKVSLSAVPARVGNTELELSLSDPDGNPVDAKTVEVSLTQPFLGIEGIEREAQRAAPGIWKVEGLVIPAPGLWTLQAEIRVSDFELNKASGEIEIAP